jgi:hypothetical protein
MTERKIEPLDFNGETIYIEVADVGETLPAGDGTREGYRKTSTQKELKTAGEQVRSTIGALSATVHEALSNKALSKNMPAEWSIEINIGFKGKAGIPFVAEGEANGAVKVTAKWVKG